MATNYLYTAHGKTVDCLELARQAKANGEWQGWPLAQVAKLIKAQKAQADRDARLADVPEADRELYM